MKSKRLQPSHPRGVIHLIFESIVGKPGDGPVPVNWGILHRTFNYLTLLNRKGCLALKRQYFLCEGLVEPHTGGGFEVIHR